MPGVEVIGEAREARRALDLAAARRPDAVVSATTVGGVAMRSPLLALRRGACPGLVVVLLGEYPPGIAAGNGEDGFVDAHFPWDELSVTTLGPALTCAISGRFVLTTRAGFASFVRDRPYLGSGTAAAPAPPLTVRERAVLRELADGRTRQEIAALVGTSQRTVGRLLDRLEEKLGASSACALVGTAARLGLLAEADLDANDATATPLPSKEGSRLPGPAQRPVATPNGATSRATVTEGESAAREASTP